MVDHAIKEFIANIQYAIEKQRGRIDPFHIVISLSLEARYLARFRVTSHAWGKL